MYGNHEKTLLQRKQMTLGLHSYVISPVKETISAKSNGKQVLKGVKMSQKPKLKLQKRWKKQTARTTNCVLKRAKKYDAMGTAVF